MIGMDWLSSLVGRPRCFDTNTMDMKRLVFATAFIEVTPNKPLPTKLCVRPTVVQVAMVDVAYSRKLDICTTCQSFGHLSDSYKHGRSTLPIVAKVPLPIPPKDPLPRPSMMKWIPIARLPTPPLQVESDVSTPLLPNDSIDIVLPTDSHTSAVDNFITWNSEEQSWIHEASKMRYSAKSDTYHKFVGEDDGFSMSSSPIRLMMVAAPLLRGEGDDLGL